MYECVRLSVSDVLRAVSEENRYYAWQRLGHEPSIYECITHYMLHSPEFLPYSIHSFLVESQDRTFDPPVEPFWVK